MPTIEVTLPRRAMEEDISACAAIVNDWVDRTEWFPRLYTPDAIEAFLRRAFPEREIWVIGTPVEGYISVVPGTGQVSALYCRKTGRGFGTSLLDAAKRGRAGLTLFTHVPNVRAQSFYRREGFVETGIFDAISPEAVPEMRMEWRR